MTVLDAEWLLAAIDMCAYFFAKSVVGAISEIRLFVSAKGESRH